MSTATVTTPPATSQGAVSSALAAGAARANEAARRRRLARIEDARFLAAEGEPPESIARRVGIAPATLVKYLCEPVTFPEPEDLADDGLDAAAQNLDMARRLARARAAAADLIRCVAATDAQGVRILLHRVRDWPALAVVLAECAEPSRAAVVTGVTADEDEAQQDDRVGARRHQDGEAA